MNFQGLIFNHVVDATKNLLEDNIEDFTLSAAKHIYSIVLRRLDEDNCIFTGNTYIGYVEQAECFKKGLQRLGNFKSIKLWVSRQAEILLAEFK